MLTALPEPTVSPPLALSAPPTVALPFVVSVSVVTFPEFVMPCVVVAPVTESVSVVVPPTAALPDVDNVCVVTFPVLAMPLELSVFVVMARYC
jgi:hypothetical protein